jgi:pyruvate dehydrogenase E2 component (dihydrolipoamide acetyltransferase)
MAREFKLPDLGEGIHEGEVLKVFVKPGDEIKEGDVILEVETDKAAVEIPSPFTGKVEEIKVKAGDTVKVGEVLMTFSDGAEKQAAEKPPKVEKKEKPEAEEKEELEEKEVVEPEEKPKKPEEAEEPEKPKEREEAKEQPKEPERRPKAKEEKPEERPEPEKEEKPAGPVPASPATRRLAREIGIDLRQVPPSGPGGRVTAEDVKAFAEGKKEKPPAEEPKPAPERPVEARLLEIKAPPLPDFAKWGKVERVPLRSIRRSTAKQMALAWSQIPHVHNQDMVDMTRLEEFRLRHREEVEAKGGKLTVTVFALKAVASALRQFPRFNASLDAESGEIVLKHYCHIGVAVSTKEGLVVPVVRDVDCKSIVELAIELSDLVQRTRERKVSLDELQGGTFTITNVGPMGGGYFAPIINYPEVSILGMGSSRMTPVAIEENGDHRIVPRLMMPIVLCIDHRILDGADALEFMRALISSLQDPERLFMTMT